MVFIAPTDYEDEEGDVAGQEGSSDYCHHQGDSPCGCSPENGIPSTSCFLVTFAFDSTACLTEAADCQELLSPCPTSPCTPWPGWPARSTGSEQGGWGMSQLTPTTAGIAENLELTDVTRREECLRQQIQDTGRSIHPLASCGEPTRKEHCRSKQQGKWGEEKHLWSSALSQICTSAGEWWHEVGPGWARQRCKLTHW